MTDYSELYDWFLKDIMKPAVIRRSETVHLVMRVPFDDDLDFIYFQDNYNGHILTPTALSYCGIYSKLNGMAYDLKAPLKGKLEEIDSNMSIVDLFQDFDKDVCRRIEELVDNNIESLIKERFTDEHYQQRLDDFRENYAFDAVKKHFLNGDCSEDLCYQCEFTMDRKDSTVMLRYLKYPEEYVEDAASNYWRNNKDDILLGIRKIEVVCKMLREIEADTENPLHKQLAVINALKDSGAKNVTVTVEKDGQRCCFKYSSDRLCRYSNSDYGTWEMSPKDRETFESCFGRHCSFHPEDIVEITYRGKTLFEADISDCSENEVVSDDESEDSEEGFTMSM